MGSNGTVDLGIYKNIQDAKDDDFSNIPVPMEYRHKWTHVMFVWFGAAMVAQLYLAGVNLSLGTGSIANAFIAVVGGSEPVTKSV